MKARHYIYDLVEDTNIKKKENIKIILLTSVDGELVFGGLKEYSTTWYIHTIFLPLKMDNYSTVIR